MPGVSWRTIRWYVGVATPLTLLVAIVHVFLVPPTGLVRTLYSNEVFEGGPLLEEVTTEVNLEFLKADSTLPDRFFSVEWRGFWYLFQPRSVDLYAGADDRVDVLVDGERVLRRSRRVGMRTISETVALGAGPHELVVRYRQYGGGKHLNVQYALAGQRPSALAPTNLFPERPRGRDFVFAVVHYWLLRLVAVVWLGPIVGLLFASTAYVLFVAGDRARPHVLPVCNSVRRTFERLTGLTISRTLHVFSFTALAVAHPLFEVVSREPAFFVARNTTIDSLVAMAAVVCLALPTMLVVIEIAFAKLGATAGSVVHTVWLMVLGAGFVMPLLKRFEGLGALGSMGLALLVGGAVALTYRRFGGVRTFATALSPAVVIVPALFLMNPDVTDAVIRTDDAFTPAVVAPAPPIVFVVFDEFPVASLLDRSHQIDRERYPNFARLADTATWYRNATTVSSQTVWAVPAIVAGRYPLDSGAVPTRRYYPNNLFTMLSGRYDMTVFGHFLQLCPPNTCTYDLEVHDDLGALVSDLSVVYAHVITPTALAAQLPPILGDWRDFATTRRFRREDGERRRNDRISEMDRFLETITGEREGRLYFLHSLSPHMPFEYVPSGHRYDAPDYQGHEEGGKRLFLNSDPWLPRVLLQRHLLQVGFVDRFVGRLMDRLKAQGIFDETLIVITADHGTSFQHALPRRSSREGTRADVMFVPLIMKFPGQVDGHVSDLNVETVDIVPTIASALSTTVPYSVDGRSMLDAAGALDRPKTFLRIGGNRVRKEQHERLEESRYVSVERRLADFSLGLYALGPHASLVGLPLSAVETRQSDETLIRLDDPPSFTFVDVESHTLPLHVRGTMMGGIDERVSVAIAVNGAIAATTQSYLEHDVWVFASLLPAESLRSGANDVKVFVAGGTDGEPILTLAAQASP